MKKDWSTVDILRYARHDWLNKIQLIKGNLDLNKTDRVKQIIEEIVIEAQQEAKLSNLKIPQFTSLLLTANWEAHPFRLEFEVYHESECLNVDDVRLTEWTSSFFDCLHTSLDLFGENLLSVTIETQKEGIRFFFEFNGIIKDIEKIKKFLEDNHSGGPAVNILDLSQEEFALDVFMPFKS
jgi:stage 0 sporulation protein B (sporulation initiation phosphotransferase)